MTVSKLFKLLTITEVMGYRGSNILQHSTSYSSRQYKLIWVKYVQSRMLRISIRTDDSVSDCVRI